MSSALRIVVDGRALVGHRTGIGVHTAEIAARLDVAPPPLLASHTSIENREGIEHCRFDTHRSALGVIWQQRHLARIAAEQGDVLWGPHGTLPLQMKTPAVATIHDLTSLTMPLRHRLKTLASFNLLIGRSIATASRVVTVSHATADEVRRGFSVELDRIVVIPNGVSPFFSPSEDAGQLPFDLQRNGYVLFVGTIEPRKGVGNLVDAWTQLPNPRPKLVICGDLGWRNSDVLRVIEHHPDRGEIIVSGYVTRDQLRELYRHCALFVYPSHYEGFGLPPLEAMACGAPVITTTAGALPEVVGDAAALVERGDVEALAREMKRLLASTALRRELSERSIARAKLFDWKASADSMLQVLKEAAAGR